MPTPDPIEEARRLAAAEVHDGDFELALCEWAHGDGLGVLLKAAGLKPIEYDADGEIKEPPPPLRKRAPERFGIGSPHWNGMSKLIEECGELLQVLGKVMALYTGTDHWDGDLVPRLIAELGDVQAAIDFFVVANFDQEDIDAIELRSTTKSALFVLWDGEQRA